MPSPTDPDAVPPSEVLTFDSSRGKLVLLATVLASGVAFLDASVVTVALPAIAEDLDAGFSALQWVLDAYLLTLGALVLVGGALGDARGMRRVFLAGIVGFAVTSLVCAVAPTAELLIAARAAQGVSAALLTPASLAILSTAFAPADRGKAIGAWSGLAGATTAVGPFIGGWLVDSGSWRWIFVLNLPLLLIAFVVTRRAVPDPPGRGRRIDLVGAALISLALTLIVAPLIEAYRLPEGVVAGLVLAGIAVGGVFVVVENRLADPMLPPALFGIRTFAVANVVTLVVYAALGASGFLLTVALQRGLGYSALQAGAASVPITIVLLLFSSRIGGLLPRFGARALLTGGSALMAVGLAAMAWRLSPMASYWVDVLPGLLVFSVGLLFIVTPVTATTLQDVPAERQGVASGTSNAVARIAALLAIAALPLASGLAAADFTNPGQVIDGVVGALWWSAAICVAGALIAVGGLPRPSSTPTL